MLVHLGAQALGLGLDVEGEFGNVNAVNLVVLAGEAEFGDELLGVEELAVCGGRGRGQVSAVAPHHLVDDQHARVGALLADDVGEEPRALFGGGPGPKGLPDRVNVVVDRLWHSDDLERVAVLRKIRGEIRGCGVRVVAANGVQDVHAVLDELLGRDFLRVLALLHESALHAVLHVRELHAGVADGGAAERVERGDVLANRRSHFDRLAFKQPLVAGDVADDLDLGICLCVFLDERGYCRGEAWGESPGRQYRNLADFFRFHGLVPWCLGRARSSGAPHGCS